MRSMNLHVPKGPGHKRQSAGSAYGACGVGWRAGQQLAWLTAKIAPLEWHVEGQILAEPLGLRLTLRLSPGHTDRAAPESRGPLSLSARLWAKLVHAPIAFGPCSGTAQKKSRGPCRD